MVPLMVFSGWLDVEVLLMSCRFDESLLRLEKTVAVLVDVGWCLVRRWWC